MASPAFGDLLRRYRVSAGFSQESLAERAGISAESIGALERGVRRAPYRATLAQLADALALSVDDRAALEAAAAVARARRRNERFMETTIRRRPSLPLQSTSFVGRAADIAAIARLVEERRLVTVTGSGGVGKTRTVINVAQQLIDRWDRLAFVDLSPLVDGSLLPATIATAIGAPPPGASDPLGDLIGSLPRSRTLIVLDTCEHVIDAAAAAASAILTNCPDVSLLATSRERLAVPGELVYRLPSLEVPTDEPQTLEAARRDAGVELFVQRFGTDESSLAFAHEHLHDIVGICRQLDGIPLAIELAAARVPALGFDSLRTRLQNGLDLGGGFRTLPQRQQTIMATIAWSYDLLAASERALLERLSVFAGGFTLEAADAVCSGDGLLKTEVAIALAALVDKSLVNVSLAPGRSVRYGMLDSVRAFASERLSATPAGSALSRRHAAWLASLADSIDEHRAALTNRHLREIVDPELFNARKAVSWAFGSSSSADHILGARIVGGLRTIWLGTSRLDECRELAERALTVIADDHPELSAKLYRALVQTADGEALIALEEAASEAFARVDDRLAIGLLHGAVATGYSLDGRLEEADRAITRAYEVVSRATGLVGMPYATFLAQRGNIHVAAGRFELARTDFLDGAAIVESLGDDTAPLWTLYPAIADFGAGNLEAAVRTAERVTGAINDRVGYDKEALAAYAVLASCFLKKGRLDQADHAVRDVVGRVGPRSLTEPTVLYVALLLAVSCSNASAAARIWGWVAQSSRFKRIPPVHLPEGYARLRFLDALHEVLTPIERTHYADEGPAVRYDEALARAYDLYVRHR